MPDISCPTESATSERGKRSSNYMPPLAYFWCRRGHVAEQDIPDVVQEVFRSVVVGIETFKKERPCDTFRGWLRTVTRSKLSDYFRTRGKSPAVPGGSDMQHRLAQLAAEPDDDPRCRGRIRRAGPLLPRVGNDSRPVRAADLGRLLAGGRR